MTAANPAAAPAPPSGSALAPFGHASFAVLWAATVLSNIGTWMHDVAAGWLMTSLAPTPLMVALVQAATTLPMFLFALPAGALADSFDKRRLLLLAQTGLAVQAFALAALAYFEAVTPVLLLLFTFLAGLGAAFTAPAWQSSVPSLVPRPVLPAAVALNTMGINISRAIGPALGGFLIAAAGVALPFALNALSFLVVIAALLWWRPPALPARHLPAERVVSGMRAGLRYARESPPLRATLARSVGFFVFASAFWALLPLIAREVLAGGPTLYGTLLAGVGAGAVVGALVLPVVKARLGPDHTMAAGAAGIAAAMVAIALLPDPRVAIGASLLAGLSWIAVLSSLNVSAQMSLPDWVRGRGLAIFTAVFFGSMTAGSVLWGQVAGWAGIPAALLIAGAGALAAIKLTWRWKLQAGDLDLAAGAYWPAPIIAADVAPDRGPVMVTIEYRVAPERRAAARAALDALGAERRRDGAFAWGVFEDAAEPARVLECFLLESWMEHLRQHERVTNADRVLQDEVQRFHIGPAPPVVTHWLAGPDDAPGLATSKKDLNRG